MLTNGVLVDRSPAPSALSFSSLESSQNGDGQGRVRVERMLARTGERFKFRVPVAADAKTGKMTKEGKGRDLEVRLVSGRALPKFFRVNLDGTGTGSGAGGRVVDLWGVPVRADVGEYEIGVYGVGGGECVGRVVVEVVERKSG